MKKKIFLLVLALALPLSTAHVYADDSLEEEETEETVEGMDIPQQPTIDESDPEGSNELINEYNTQVDAYNTYVDEYNQQVDNTYDTAYAEYEQQVQVVEENNAMVDTIETQVEEDSQILDNVGEPTDWSAEPSEGPKTIEVEEAAPEDKTGETISVINVHVYLNEDTQYTPNELYDFVGKEDFKLSDELVDSSVLIEYETAEIDYDDIVTTSSEAKDFAGNIVVLNGQRKWFGAEPKPYFFRSLEGYTQGYWTPGGSIFMSTATEEENGWSAAGETYTAQYAEKETTQNYLYNGELMTETITTRTTDKQEPKNIFSMFTYLFVRLFDEPERMDEPEAPVRGDYLKRLDKMDLIEIKDDPEPTPDPTPGTDPTPTPTPDPEPIPTVEPIIDPIPEIIPEVVTEIFTPFVITAQAEEEPAVIAEDNVEEEPEIVREVTIEDMTAPLAMPQRGTWALINLIMTIGSVIIALGMLITFIFKKTYEEDKEEYPEEEDEGKHKLTKILGLLPSVLAVIMFILTEDMTLPMVLVDKWTIPMVLIFAISVVLAGLTQNKKKEEEEEEA